MLVNKKQKIVLIIVIIASVMQCILFVPQNIKRTIISSQNVPHTEIEEKLYKPIWYNNNSGRKDGRLPQNYIDWERLLLQLFATYSILGSLFLIAKESPLRINHSKKNGSSNNLEGYENNHSKHSMDSSYSRLINEVNAKDESKKEQPRQEDNTDPSEKRVVNGKINKPNITFCRKCAYELIDGSEFCSKCGTNVIKDVSE